MFSKLTEKLSNVLKNISKKGILKEKDVKDMIREIRLTFIDADVHLSVIKYFAQIIEEKAIGQKILESLNPTQMILKIISDELVQLFSNYDSKFSNQLNFKSKSPYCYLMVGLQGSGKTTNCAKLSKYIEKIYNKNVLLVSLDFHRPKAREQLEILAQQNNLKSYPIFENKNIIETCDDAILYAKKNDIDIIIFDTQGRMDTNEEMMIEISKIQKHINPIETLYVCDILMGQTLFDVLETFKKHIEITGGIMTKVDSDAKAGSILSYSYITKTPIKFLSVGEKIDDLTIFSPENMARRILDQGDSLNFIEKILKNANNLKTEEMYESLEHEKFNMNQFKLNLENTMQLGGLQNIFDFLPNSKQLKNQLKNHDLSDKILIKHIAIINSMTKKERLHPKILDASRKRRIARGAGVTPHDVNQLLEKYENSEKMMKKMQKESNIFESFFTSQNKKKSKKRR